MDVAKWSPVFKVFTYNWDVLFGPEQNSFFIRCAPHEKVFRDKSCTVSISLEVVSTQPENSLRRGTAIHTFSFDGKQTWYSWGKLPVETLQKKENGFLSAAGNITIKIDLQLLETDEIGI